MLLIDFLFALVIVFIFMGMALVTISLLFPRNAR